MALFMEASSQCLKQIIRKPSLTSMLIPFFQQSTTVSVGPIDAFTNNLVEERGIKLKLLEIQYLKEIEMNRALKAELVVAAKSIATDIRSVSNPDLLEVDIRQLNCKQLGSLILSSIDSEGKEDFLYLIDQCLKWEVLPSVDTTLESLHHLSLLGKTEVINSIGLLLEKSDDNTSEEYAKLAPFKGVALWRAGNLQPALETLSSCYRFSLTKKSRGVLRAALRLISEETLKFKSEAVLVSLLKLAETINREFQDVFLTNCVWKNCFESDWFSDQQVACKLFEDCPQLRDAVYKRPSSLCYNFLTTHKVDAVHRLIELLLKYEKKDACKVCLNILFEYNYWRQDLRACGEIIKSSLELDIPLKEDKSQKLLNLLLNKPSLLAKKPAVGRFQYKF